ncbi:MAG: DUF58 domain-containing protein [Chloroflexota bacterium]
MAASRIRVPGWRVVRGRSNGVAERASGSGRGPAALGPLPRRGVWAWASRNRMLVGLLGVIFVSVLAGMATGFELSFRLAYIVAIMMVIAFFWSRWDFARLEARVQRPSGPLRVGDELSETVQLYNHGGLPKAWVEVEDETDIPGLRIGKVVNMPSVVTHRQFTVSVTLTQRGRYHLGPLKIRSADPFGLFPTSNVYQDADSLLVYPRAVSLPDFALASSNLSGDTGHRRRSQVASPHISSVREYVHGDRVRYIHWPSTARQSRLMVKLFDQGEAANVWVVWDQHRGAVAGRDAESTDEYGASLAISTVHKYRGMQLPVGYAAQGSERLVAPPARGPEQLDAITRHIASSKPEGDVSLMEFLAALERDILGNSALVVITATADRECVDALESMARRGVNVSVALMDRETFGPANGGAETGVTSNKPLLSDLVRSGFRVYSIRQGEAIAAALSQPVRPRDVPGGESASTEKITRSAAAAAAGRAS